MAAPAKRVALPIIGNMRRGSKQDSSTIEQPFGVHCSRVLRHLSDSHCSQAACLRLERGLRYVEEAG